MGASSPGLSQKYYYYSQASLFKIDTCMQKSNNKVQPIIGMGGSIIINMGHRFDVLFHWFSHLGTLLEAADLVIWR